MGKHKFHELVGEKVSSAVKNIGGYSILLDTACGGDHRLSLFRSVEASLKTRFCDADILVIKDGKVMAIIEIEESNVKPNHICGKYLSSALSKYYCKNKLVEKCEIHSCAFIQILCQESKDGSKKREQWELVEDAINGVVPVADSSIRSYKLFTLNTSKPNFEEFITYLKKELSV